MIRLVRCPSLLLVLFAFLLGGCGKQEAANDAPVGDAPTTAETGLAANSETPPPAGTTADAAVLAVLDGLRQNNPQALWDFLPTSYQQDVNDTVHEFAEKMDAELWNRVFGTLNKITEILKTKKEFILSHPELQGAEKVDPQQMAANWDGVLELFATLLGSELFQLDELKNIDVGTYLAKTGGSLMRQASILSKLSPDDPFGNQFHQKLADAEVELLESDGDRALVKLTTADPEDEPKDIEFVRVEEKWIPATLAESWDLKMTELKTKMSLAMAPEVISERKVQTLQILDMVDPVLDQLLQAETVEDFHAVVNETVAPGLGLLMLQQGMVSRDTAARSGDPSNESVVVQFTSKLDQASEDALIDKLLDRVDQPDLGLAPPPVATETGTRLEVSPVQDVAAFAKRIDFGKVIDVNVETRTITVELSEPKGDTPGEK
jgi:hypothetical protein